MAHFDHREIVAATLIQDPRYVTYLQRDAREYLADPDHPVFDLVDRTWLAEQVKVDSTQVGRLARMGLERTLDLALWLDMYKPSLKLT